MVVLSVTSRLSGKIAMVVNTAATEKNNRDAQEATWFLLDRRLQ